MQAIAFLLAVVGVALALLGLGIKAKLGNVELDWSDKPSSWLILPVAACLFGGGIWLAVEAGRSPSTTTVTAKKEADPSAIQPPGPDNASEANSTLAAAPPVTKPQVHPGSRTPSRSGAPAPPGPAVQAPVVIPSASAKNGSVAVVGNITGSNLSASAAGNGSRDEQ